MDRGTQGAIASATVVARSESGRVVGQTVADTAGKFVLALNAPGSYHLRAERIGYRPVTTVGFDVDPHETVQVDLFLGVGAVELDPLTITSRAGRPH
ncbi:MAG TPA: carboxypeptidase-like regulatory domain-containing protein, partial [Archangium sp.]